MDRSIAITDALVVAAEAPNALAARHAARHASQANPAAPTARLSREDRIAHVFRTRGRGLVAEYEPA